MVGARTLRPAQQSIREPRAGCRGAGIATAEDFFAGGTADGRDRAIRKVIAAGRHDLVNSARELRGSVDAGAPLMIRPPGTPLWPEPHDLRFDFGASASGNRCTGDARRAAPSSGTVLSPPPAARLWIAPLPQSPGVVSRRSRAGLRR